MFEQGSLLFIRDFDFSTIDGSLSKINSFRDKYLLVIDNIGNTSIFCCFTTTLRNEKLFHSMAKVGCNKTPYKYHIFHFEPKVVVTDKQFTFPDLTFIAGNKGQIFEYDLPLLCSKYKLKGQIIHKGNLSKELLFDIIYCLHNSPTIDKYLRDDLFNIGDQIQNEIQRAQENP